ncbi:hypothetical protein Sjap_025916 [Stephania japonica]|uniref:Uncharacterized protein n=1 Tax=Stephania japonica TaxID=461633 RepID=A0AAP0E551_9MAGN
MSTQHGKAMCTPYVALTTTRRNINNSRISPPLRLIIIDMDAPGLRDSMTGMATPRVVRHKHGLSLVPDIPSHGGTAVVSTMATDFDMARGKSTVSRDGVDGEPTRAQQAQAQRVSAVAAAPSGPAAPSIPLITLRWPPIPTIIVNSKTHTMKVKVCGICGDNTHPTDVCPYEPKYESYPYSGNASPLHNILLAGLMQYNMNLSKLVIILVVVIIFLMYVPLTSGTEQDIYLTEQELDQWIQEKNKKAEDEIKLIIQKRSMNTISAIPLNSVEVKDEEYMSNYEESEGELEVSQSEPEIVMAQTYEEEAEKEIEVTLIRPEVGARRRFLAGSVRNRHVALSWRKKVARVSPKFWETAPTRISRQIDDLDLKRP